MYKFKKYSCNCINKSLVAALALKTLLIVNLKENGKVLFEDKTPFANNDSKTCNIFFSKDEKFLILLSFYGDVTIYLTYRNIYKKIFAYKGSKGKYSRCECYPYWILDNFFFIYLDILRKNKDSGLVRRVSYDGVIKDFPLNEYLFRTNCVVENDNQFLHTSNGVFKKVSFINDNFILEDTIQRERDFNRHIPFIPRIYSFSDSKFISYEFISLNFEQGIYEVDLLAKTHKLIVPLKLNYGENSDIYIKYSKEDNSICLIHWKRDISNIFLFISFVELYRIDLTQKTSSLLFSKKNMETKYDLISFFDEKSISFESFYPLSISIFLL